eukprot:7284701-Alexandrium_andersonii.AAC.1
MPAIAVVGPMACRTPRGGRRTCRSTRWCPVGASCVAFWGQAGPGCEPFEPEDAIRGATGARGTRGRCSCPTRTSRSWL